MKKSSYILLIIAGIALIFLYFVEIRPDKRSYSEPAKADPAFDFKRENIVSITITREGQSITLESEGGNKWKISQPVNYPADEFAANALANAILETHVENAFHVTDIKLSEYGLKNPKVKIDVKLKSNTTHHIDLGRKDPTESGVYAKIDGGANVHVINNPLLEHADKPLNDFRERNLFHLSQNDFASIKINNEMGGVELAKKNGTWVLKSASKADIDDGKVTALINEITSAKAIDFISESSNNPSKYGLDKPKISVTIKFNNSSQRTLSIGSKNKDNKFYAKVSDYPQIVTVDQGLTGKLNIDDANLIN